MITWTGAVEAGTPVTLTYSAILSEGLTAPTAIIHPVLIDDGQGNVEELQAISIVNGYPLYLPVVMK